MDRQKRADDPQMKQKRKRTVLWALLALAAACAVLGGWQAYRILKKPASLFTEAAATAVPEPSVLAPAFPIASASPAPEAPTTAPADTAQPMLEKRAMLHLPVK